MEEFSVVDPSLLLQAASDFANYPSVQSEASVKDFLDRFPIPVIINALETQPDVPGLENALVACLERIFRTKYGASLIPQYVPFVQLGLKADSQLVRCLACKTVSCFLDACHNSISVAKLLSEYGVYPLLLDCLIDGNEQVAAVSMDAIKGLASFPEGLDIIFPANNDEPIHLRNLAAHCTSLGRVRVLALIVKLFSISSSVASVVHRSNLLSLFEAEVSNSTDTLVTLSGLELLYELAEIQHGAEFLPRTALLQLLASIISNSLNGSITRSRAMAICGRLLLQNDLFMSNDESSVKAVIAAIDGRLALLENQDTYECESALEALGQIGTTTRGATLLLLISPPAAMHVIQTVFDQQGRGKQLAVLHALANISGETRSDDTVVLNADAEESLRLLIYETASKSSKLTPSGLFFSLLRQDSEIRLAGYRLITGLVARPWCLIEVCSKQDVISIVADACTESTKICMEARYNCCKAILKALMSTKLVSDPALAGTAAKLQDAVEKGPYLTTRKRSEAQPTVVTDERF